MADSISYKQTNPLQRPGRTSTPRVANPDTAQLNKAELKDLNLDPHSQDSRLAMTQPNKRKKKNDEEEEEDKEKRISEANVLASGEVKPRALNLGKPTKQPLKQTTTKTNISQDVANLLLPNNNTDTKSNLTNILPKNPNEPAVTKNSGKMPPVKGDLVTNLKAAAQGSIEQPQVGTASHARRFSTFKQEIKQPEEQPKNIEPAKGPKSIQPLRYEEKEMDHYTKYITTHNKSIFNNTNNDLELTPEYTIEIFNEDNDLVKKKKFKNIKMCENFLIKNNEVFERNNLQVKIYENNKLMEVDTTGMSVFRSGIYNLFNKLYSNKKNQASPTETTSATVSPSASTPAIKTSTGASGFTTDLNTARTAAEKATTNTQLRGTPEASRSFAAANRSKLTTSVPSAKSTVQALTPSKPIQKPAAQAPVAPKPQQSEIDAQGNPVGGRLLSPEVMKAQNAAGAAAVKRLNLK